MKWSSPFKKLLCDPQAAAGYPQWSWPCPLTSALVSSPEIELIVGLIRNKPNKEAQMVACMQGSIRFLLYHHDCALAQVGSLAEVGLASGPWVLGLRSSLLAGFPLTTRCTWWPCSHWVQEGDSSQKWWGVSKTLDSLKCVCECGWVTWETILWSSRDAHILLRMGLPHPLELCLEVVVVIFLWEEEWGYKICITAQNTLMAFAPFYEFRVNHGPSSRPWQKKVWLITTNSINGLQGFSAGSS